MANIDTLVARITGEQHPYHGFVRVSKTSDLIVTMPFFVKRNSSHNYSRCAMQ
jgi:hypothetical protein